MQTRSRAKYGGTPQRKIQTKGQVQQTKVRATRMQLRTTLNSKETWAMTCCHPTLTMTRARMSEPSNHRGLICKEGGRRHTRRTMTRLRASTPINKLLILTPATIFPSKVRRNRPRISWLSMRFLSWSFLGHKFRVTINKMKESQRMAFMSTTEFRRKSLKIIEKMIKVRIQTYKVLTRWSSTRHLTT